VRISLKRLPVLRTRGAILGVGAAAAFLYSNFLLAWIFGDSSQMWVVVSELEAPGEPGAVLLRVTDVVCAVLVIIVLPAVRLALPRGLWREIVVWGTVVFALGAAGAALIPLPCGPDVVCTGSDQVAQERLHNLSSQLSDVALFVGVAASWLATRGPGPRWFARAAFWTFWLVGVGSSIAFGYLYATDQPSWAAGASQRVHIVGISGWIVCLALLAASRPAAPETFSPSSTHKEAA
jgi:hypothetical protein